MAKNGEQDLQDGCFCIFKTEDFMESIVDVVFNAENVRMLVLLAFGFCGYAMVGRLDS